MRILLFLFAFCLVFPAVSQAQEASSGTKRYYNPPSTGGSNSVYIPPSATANVRRGSPIPLNQILQGRSSDTRYSPTSVYGGSNARSSGSRNDFSLSLSPQEVKARRVAREKEVRAVERQNKLIAQRSKKFNDLDIMDEAYIDQFRRVPEVPGGATQARSSSTSRQPVKVYRRPDTLETPKRIFNSVY